MGRRRAAALAALALLAAGCGSSSHPRPPALPATGPPNVIRIGLAHLLWPLDPARARSRDEIVLARVLFATPLRTDPATGALRPGLCTRWSSSNGGRSWRFRCSHAGAIARELRRAKLGLGRIDVSGRTLAITQLVPSPELPYLLTMAAAAPPGVPGPFRLISASPARVVAEQGTLRLVFSKLDPHEAVRLFRAGRLDEAPVPLGDLRADQRDPRLSPSVRVRRLLAVDAVVADPHGALAKLPELRRVYADTADRADYQALVPEFAAPPAESLTQRSAPTARAAALATRRARSRIGHLPRVAVRFAEPADPDLAYGASLLVASWRDIGLGAYIGTGRPAARFERLLAPWPQLDALKTAADPALTIPIAWVADARLVSRRLRGWREDELGTVDYSRVRFREPSPSR